MKYTVTLNDPDIAERVLTAIPETIGAIDAIGRTITFDQPVIDYLIEQHGVSPIAVSRIEETICLVVGTSAYGIRKTP